MDPVLASCVQTLKTNSYLYKKALEGLDKEALHKRCGEESNPMIWLAGHVANSRCGLANFIGLKREMRWQKLFGRYSKIGEQEAYPDISEILKEWTDGNSALKRRFEQLTEAELSAPASREFPVEDKTLRGGIAFLVWHEAYHIGQMGYLRKWLGYQSLVG